MITVHKYGFVVADRVVVRMPRAAMIRCVSCQTPRHICIWATVDTKWPLEDNVFNIRGTGHPCEDVGTYRGTAFDGPYVWHVFEEVAK